MLKDEIYCIEVYSLFIFQLISYFINNLRNSLLDKDFIMPYVTTCLSIQLAKRQCKNQ